MNKYKTIVLVLKEGNGFSFKDVLLIERQINWKWKSHTRPHIICLWNKATEHYKLGNIELLPLTNKDPGTWSRISLYGPEMEQYRPFLYVDLDTAVINSLENIFDLVKDQSQFITLEDFWQKGQLATGLVWFPANSEKIKKVWENYKGVTGKRMDKYISQIVSPDLFWQQLTSNIYDFKPKRGNHLTNLVAGTDLVCFHGTPRIHDAQNIKWVKNYIGQSFPDRKRVTVIIPYNKDRGWLKEAIDSVPKNVQLIVSQGSGNWPENFNKVLNQAEGDYIRWLHEDDMLTENCIEDSITAIEEQGVDFIHGQAVEIFMNAGRATQRYTPSVKIPTVEDMLRKNVIHSATLMYRREVFEKVGKMDETLNTAEEFEFNLRCLKAGLKIGYCDSPLAFYRRHAQQKVRTVPVDEKNREREQVKSLYR